MFWLQLRGYFVFGATDESFRSAIAFAFKALGLSYEERLSAIHVPSEGFDVQVAVQAWMGTAQMKSKQAKGKTRVGELAGRMSEYFAANKVETNATAFVIYIVLGVFLLAVVGCTSLVLSRHW